MPFEKSIFTRLEIHQLMQTNCFLMEHNASLIRAQATLIHWYNLKQNEVNELNAAIIHLNQMQLHAHQQQQQQVCNKIMFH
jgi:hypothetical protein